MKLTRLRERWWKATNPDTFYDSCTTHGPFSEWFNWDGVMWCYPCGFNWRGPIRRSKYSTHRQYRELLAGELRD